MITISYPALENFAGLQALREAVANGDQGFLVNDLPSLPAGIQVDSKHNIKLQKDHASSSTALTSPDAATELMRMLHQCSHTIFNNLSHVLELPWEKYLGEMHEFTAPGRDELQTVNAKDRIANAWSTLTIVISSDNPGKALVLFGTALSVFSEGLTPELSQYTIAEQFLSSLSIQPEGKWVVYYVRPNDDVFYTRTAGALMTPLSTSEYESRKRVKEVITI
ncbi:unnamed protein product [Clonostachys rosea f. rosea IK726]|uniref:Uncharacterized protein n=1 Tax=Clonostachys rosea f. rosea IK726 TaxID=1349383 RepID=A0ACA9UIY5_BIOOC|nr:unnamed protein product [Clonostachys rosea f. rosea IK726]